MQFNILSNAGRRLRAANFNILSSAFLPAAPPAAGCAPPAPFSAALSADMPAEAGSSKAPESEKW